MARRLVLTTARALPFWRSACSTTTCPGLPSSADASGAVGVEAACPLKATVRSRWSSRSGESSSVVLCEPTSARVALSTPVVS